MPNYDQRSRYQPFPPDFANSHTDLMKRHQERMDHFDKQFDKVEKRVWWIAALIIIGWLLFWATVLFVGIHFLAKVW